MNTDRQKDSQKNSQSHRQTDSQSHRQRNRKIDKQTDSQEYRQADSQKEKQTDIRLSDRQTYKHQLSLQEMSTIPEIHFMSYHANRFSSTHLETLETSPPRKSFSLSYWADNLKISCLEKISCKHFSLVFSYFALFTFQEEVEVYFLFP
jgi:recombination DNA repair RAD52 pathway protein